MLSNPSATHPSCRFACYVVDVDIRLTDEAAALGPLQFVAQTVFDEQKGDLYLSEAAPNAASSLSKGDAASVAAQKKGQQDKGAALDNGLPSVIMEETPGESEGQPAGGLGGDASLDEEEAARLRRFAVITPNC